MKTIFVVAAHPDDEVLGCGGTLLKHVHDGDKVYILFISDHDIDIFISKANRLFHILQNH